MLNVMEPGRIDTNYFVATLGLAAAINKEKPHDFHTVSQLLDRQASRIPHHPAIGFALPSKDVNSDSLWDYQIFSFRRLRQGSISFARLLHGLIQECSLDTSTPKQTVALLCPSSPIFLLSWLGLVRLGYAVLLIAPQCQPAAVAHLCKTCGVSILFYDEQYDRLVKDSVTAANSTLHPILLPLTSYDNEIVKYLQREEHQASDISPLWPVSEHDVAYLFHSSGTSTGLPKSIAQTHFAAVGVLPCLDHGKESATFTTTPLYHGGIADCFRGLTSDAMTWLFPGKAIPITADNILKSLESATISVTKDEAPPVRYFSSVPYVLQMLSADPKGLHILQSLEIVGVGGAALPQTIGDDLVEKGVNLITRFGSTECGFLMTSHRDYTQDKSWEYLRSTYGCEALSFEERENLLVELVVLSQWPYMAKRNREDGSYATADLFALHPTIPKAWKYHSRADSQITLNSGKKFDPAPLEDAISTSPLLNDVLVFGDGRLYPGALLFRSKASSELPSAELLEKVWPQIERLSAEGQQHTRLSKSMLKVMPANAQGLEKSSKGSVLRGQAVKRYHNQIETAYKEEPSSIEQVNGQSVFKILDHEMAHFVLKTIQEVMNNAVVIPEDADLFSSGIDSVASMQIRAILQNQAMPKGSASLPLNAVYDCGTIKGLSKYLVNLRKGKSIEVEDEIALMKTLVKDLGTFSVDPKDPSRASPATNRESFKGEVVILTGATGALGAHILDQLRSDPSVSQILCLVRGTDIIAAQSRVSKSLAQRQKPTLDPSGSKISCIVVKLGKTNLGLSDEVYQSLRDRVTMIIHAAWAVNFSMRLRSFIKDHVTGLRNLLDLALASTNKIPPRFIFCSSIASVTGPAAKSPILEAISHDPNAASPLGYSRSKWVAEAICEQASLQLNLNGRLSVVRIGQLCGDSQSGVWNVTEAWPLMLSTVKVTGSLPALRDEKLAWLPLDIAAKAVLQIAVNQQKGTEDRITVYHLVNGDRSVSWMNLLEWIKSLNAESFEIISAIQWVQRLESLEGEATKHPARKLLGLWKNAYCMEKQQEEIKGKKGDLVLSTVEAEKVAGVIREVRPISEEQFERIWKWMEKEMFAESVTSECVEETWLA